MADPLKHLIYVDDELPGITRRRAGKGWAYYDPEGKRIEDKAERKRLNAIALPPAYTDAWYCPAPNGHILATGFDAAGRKQYRYHGDFRTHRESEKFDGCIAFGKLLPLVRKKVEQDLRGKAIGQTRVVAGVVRLLDMGAVRVGNDAYAKSNKSFGATTLTQNHVTVNGARLVLDYRGKSGQEQHVELSDKALATIIQQLQDLPGQRLFQYIDDDGSRCQVDSSDVNAYLREAMGQDFTAKNFRTWHGSVEGFSVLAQAKSDVAMGDLLEQVAGRLGNTPAVTRKSYIHPAILSLVERPSAWRGFLKLPRSTKYLTREERGLIALLESAPAAAELLAA